MSNFKEQFGLICIDDNMPFGKYAGCTIESILEEDPDYMKWAVEEEILEFDDDILYAVEELYD